MVEPNTWFQPVHHQIAGDPAAEDRIPIIQGRISRILRSPREPIAKERGKVQSRRHRLPVIWIAGQHTARQLPELLAAAPAGKFQTAGLVSDLLYHDLLPELFLQRFPDLELGGQ